MAEPTVPELTVASCTAFLVERVAVIFDQPDVTAADNLLELGGDSLWILRLVNEIEKKFDISVDIVDAFQSESLAAFGQLVWETATGVTDAPTGRT